MSDTQPGPPATRILRDDELESDYTMCGGAYPLQWGFDLIASHKAANAEIARLKAGYMRSVECQQQQLVACTNPQGRCQWDGHHVEPCPLVGAPVGGSVAARIAELEAAHARAVAERDWMVDVLVERWHETAGQIDNGKELHDWMEFTDEQYGRWAMDPMDFPPVPSRTEHGFYECRCEYGRGRRNGTCPKCHRPYREEGKECPRHHGCLPDPCGDACPEDRLAVRQRIDEAKQAFAEGRGVQYLSGMDDETIERLGGVEEQQASEGSVNG